MRIIAMEIRVSLHKDGMDDKRTRHAKDVLDALWKKKDGSGRSWP